jgi:hypothetical protein
MKKKRTIGLIGCALLFLILVIPYKPALVFTYQNTDRVVAYIPTDMRNEAFQIQFTHTIHLSDVVETYRVDDDNQIIQTEFMYEDFNVGMPSNATGQEKFVEKNGKYYITNMERIFPYLDIRIARTIPNHNLLYNGDAFSLLSYLEPGTWTRVSSKKMNMWQQLKGVNILDERNE